MEVLTKIINWIFNSFEAVVNLRVEQKRNLKLWWSQISTYYDQIILNWFEIIDSWSKRNNLRITILNYNMHKWAVKHHKRMVFENRSIIIMFYKWNWWNIWR